MAPSSTFCLILFLAVFMPLTAGLRFGEMCDSSRIYSATWTYDDSCGNVYLFCDPASNTCNYKGCTNTDYLQGWDTTIHSFPSRCTGNMYCPDDSSSCKDKIAPGGFCELQRDDECSGDNAICLNSTCFVKAAPLGGNCGSDTTLYVTYDANYYAVQQVIIRDNCTQGTYCGDTGQCIPSKALGAMCDQDRECLSGYCSNGGTCINGPDVFHTIPNWLWGVVGAAIVLFVLLTLLLLWYLHRYQSEKERAKVLKFFGDNEEFAKFAMLEGDYFVTPSSHRPESVATRTTLGSTTASPSTTRPPSVVFLATPDYNESSALAVGGNGANGIGKRRSLVFRSNSSPTPPVPPVPPLPALPRSLVDSNNIPTSPRSSPASAVDSSTTTPPATPRRASASFRSQVPGTPDRGRIPDQ